jgi:hypothetical protein
VGQLSVQSGAAATLSSIVAERAVQSVAEELEANDGSLKLGENLATPTGASGNILSQSNGLVSWRILPASLEAR